MRPWLEVIGVALLAALAGAAGYWAGSRRRPWWALAYAPGLVLVLAVAAGQRCHTLTFVRPFSWVAAGRREFVIMGVGCALLFGALLPRLSSFRVRALVGLLTTVSVAAFSVAPFLGPALSAGYLRSLKTVIDPHGVCIQATDYTCGPAAAVTALRQLGFPAEEGELAVLAHTSPGTGTPADLLCEAMRARYGKEGLTCEYRPIGTIADLKEAGVVIASVKYRPFVDHYVTVLAVTDDKVVVGDPLVGERRLTHEQFSAIWRRLGIELRVTGGRGK